MPTCLVPVLVQVDEPCTLVAPLEDKVRVVLLVPAVGACSGYISGELPLACHHERTKLDKLLTTHDLDALALEGACLLVISHIHVVLLL